MVPCKHCTFLSNILSCAQQMPLSVFGFISSTVAPCVGTAVGRMLPIVNGKAELLLCSCNLPHQQQSAA